MSDMGVTVGEFRIGRVLSKGFTILFRNIVPFGLIALLAMSPPLLYALAVDPWILLGDDVHPGTELVIRIVEGLLGSFLAAAVVYGTAQDLRGRRAGTGACIGRGLAVMLQVLGVAFVAGLLIGLATLLFIVPGLIVATMLWVAIPVAVMEKNGLSALSRSSALTRGYRWKVFGLIVLLYLILVVPIVGVGFLMVLFEENIMIVNAALMGVVAFYYALSAVVSTVGYHELRLVKEGAGMDEIAAVFD
jgi:hypothetical protein